MNKVDIKEVKNVKVVKVMWGDWGEDVVSEEVYEYWNEWFFVKDIIDGEVKNELMCEYESSGEKFREVYDYKEIIKRIDIGVSNDIVIKLVESNYDEFGGFVVNWERVKGKVVDIDKGVIVEDKDIEWGEFSGEYYDEGMDIKGKIFESDDKRYYKFVE